MSKPIDHIAYLSQEIGPRPAGTEEEQQAALYITERFQKETRLPVNIEDFTCSSNADMPKLICYIVTIVAVLLGLFLPIAVIPAVVASVLSAAVFVAESFDKPILSQLFMKGVSQNVVAKYEPSHDPDGAGSRRRKVILVANYDSGKVRHDLAGFLPSIKRPMQYAAIVSMCLLPVVLLIRQFAFAGEGIGATACLVIAVILLVAVVVPAAFIALEKASAYNEGANSNASGIAVMLEVARRIGSGEASGEPFPEGVMHDEETARAAGVVPDGATLSYEHGAGDAGDQAYMNDELLSEGPSAEELSRMRKETRSALTSDPIETLAAAAAKAAELHEAAEAAEAARREQEEADRLAAEAEAEERARLEEEMRLAAEAAKAKPTPTVPEWYLKATEKARKSEPLLGKSESSYRSRYADFPDERRVVEEEVMPEDEPIEIQEIPGSVEQVPYEDDFAVESGSEQRAAVEDDSTAVEPVEQDAQGEVLAAVEEAESEQHVSEQKAPDASVQGLSVGQQGDSAPAASEAVQSAEDSEAGATTAMPAVSDAGALDLEALRAAASEVASEPVEAVSASDAPASVEAPVEEAAASEATAAVPVIIAEQAQPVEADAAPVDAAVPVSPQMMYYKEPEDRSQEMMDRARKERSVVTLTADEVKDTEVSIEEAVPVASSAEVTSIPVEGAVREVAETASVTPVAAASTAVMPVQPAAAPQPAPVAPAQKQADRIIEARVPVVDLPNITLPAMQTPDPRPVSFEELRQRAPLASAAESKGEEAAKDLLSISLPSIDGPSGATGSFARIDAPQTQNTSVSLTGSFAPVGAIGAEPVGDELIENVDPEDVYVDDADDSVFEEEFTETGAFAGPGYVEMPQSRVGRFFGKFRRKKKDEEQSAHEWLDVDENFDARSAGKARGSWESFRNEDDDWQGGAFDGIKARLPRNEDEEGEGGSHEGRARLSAPAVSHDAFAAALAAANAAAEAKGEKPVAEDDPYEEDMQQIYSFAAGDINTEVWFVALGSELAGNGGIKAFLAEHASDMRGAVIVNLESLGAGTLSYLEKEGELRQASCSPRMKRFVRKASQASGVSILASRIDWRESAASYAQKHRMQAMTLVGMDGNKPARYGEADDIIENIDPDALDRSADMVIELLKNI